jgi:hypothetical protein
MHKIVEHGCSAEYGIVQYAVKNIYIYSIYVPISYLHVVSDSAERGTKRAQGKREKAQTSAARRNQ